MSVDNQERIDRLEAAIKDQEAHKKFILDFGFTMNGQPPEVLAKEPDRIIELYKRLIEKYQE
ncbi:hypothetical protein [Leisingera sp. ANG59]|uniref:hypothetical protein n=1 Tax=Leisingera sp. ANG59 TaxID=2675221 RepID=UPI00157459A7|nr:hypothetical protein [Leisingera sp. ANG59]NSY36855.1 hypothetical protein [Leisingera sp. ANG59]